MDAMNRRGFLGAITAALAAVGIGKVAKAAPSRRTVSWLGRAAEPVATCGIGNNKSRNIVYYTQVPVTERHLRSALRSLRDNAPPLEIRVPQWPLADMPAPRYHTYGGPTGYAIDHSRGLFVHASMEEAIPVMVNPALGPYSFTFEWAPVYNVSRA